MHSSSGDCSGELITNITQARSWKFLGGLSRPVDDDDDAHIEVLCARFLRSLGVSGVTLPQEIVQYLDLLSLILMVFIFWGQKVL